VEPFWQMYAQHKQPQVRHLLRQSISSMLYPQAAGSFVACQVQRFSLSFCLEIKHRVQCVCPCHVALLPPNRYSTVPLSLQVYEMLEAMRIGTLPEKDRITTSSNPYANDPKRVAAIAALSTTPFNGESPVTAMLSYITPTELHFKRNHLPVPEVLPQAYELQVGTEEVVL
jgi:hypothetical protein